MIGQCVAVAFLVVLHAAPARACSGTVLLDADSGDGDDRISITKGETLSGFDHLLRDRDTSDIVLCTSKHCYPAFGLDQYQRPQEIIRLRGCKIAHASSSEGGLERYEIEDKTVHGHARGPRHAGRPHL